MSAGARGSKCIEYIMSFIATEYSLLDYVKETPNYRDASPTKCCYNSEPAFPVRFPVRFELSGNSEIELAIPKTKKKTQT